MTPPAPLHVALDARMTSPPSGVGLYVSELLRALAVDREALGLRLTAVAAPDQPLPPGVERLPTRVPFDRHGPAELFEHVALPRRLAARGVEVLHGPSTIIPLWPGRVATVATIHDLVFWRHGETMPAALRALMRLRTEAALRRADTILAVSAFTAEELRRFSPQSDRVVAVPSGTPQVTIDHRVDPERAGRLLAGLGLHAGRFVCAVGNLEPRKNLATLLDAFAAARVGDARLALLGDRGWRTGALEAALQRIGPDRVVLTGWIDDTALRDLLASSAGLLYPSLYEGFGFPPLEALALGRPAASSDLPPVRASCGARVQLLDPLDLSAWTAAIEAMLTSPAGPGAPWVGRDFAAVARDTAAVYRNARAHRLAR